MRNRLLDKQHTQHIPFPPLLLLLYPRFQTFLFSPFVAVIFFSFSPLLSVPYLLLPLACPSSSALPHCAPAGRGSPLLPFLRRPGGKGGEHCRRRRAPHHRRPMPAKRGRPLLVPDNKVHLRLSVENNTQYTALPRAKPGAGGRGRTGAESSPHAAPFPRVAPAPAHRTPQQRRRSTGRRRGAGGR